MIDYAILSAAGQVIEIRTFASVLPLSDIKKADDGLPLARPIEDVKPALTAGEQYSALVMYEVLDDKVRRVFAAERMPPPDEIPMWKAKAVLHQEGQLDAVNAAVAQQASALQLAWAHAGAIRRDSPAVVLLASLLSYSDQQLDDWFRQAEALTL